MRILHIIPNLGVGGTEKVLVEICRGLDPSKFENAVLSLKSGGVSADALMKAGVPVRLLRSPDRFWPGLFDLPRLFFAVRGHISEFKPDVVHTWLSRANFIGRIAAKFAGTGRVVSGLRVMEKEKGYHLWAEKLLASFCEIVTVNCTPLKDFAVNEIGIPEEKVRLIFNGIRLSDADLKSGDRTRPGNLTVGTMGRLHSQKGIDVFLNAVPQVLKRHPDCRFEVGGEGPEMERLQALAGNLGIEKNVSFAGLVRSEEFLRRTDIFVLASRWEGMPNAVMEAMAKRLPVAASSVGGVADLIEDGKEGLLFPSGDSRACAEAILRFLESPDLRSRLGAQAQKKISDKFGIDNMISSHARMYETLISRP